MTEFRTKHLIIAGAVGMLLAVLVMWLIGRWNGRDDYAPGRDTRANHDPAAASAASSDQGLGPKASADSRTNPAFVPLPDLSIPFSESFPELKRRADAGDPWAACHLAVELIRCRQAITTIENPLELSRWQQTVDQEGLGPEDSKAVSEFNRKVVANFTLTAERCEAVPQENFWLAQSYLRRAATSGLRTGKRMYISGLGFDGDHIIATLKDPSYKAWTQDAPRFLERMLQAGDPTAVTTLAGVYGNDMSLLSTLYEPDSSQEALFMHLYYALKATPPPDDGHVVKHKDSERLRIQAQKMHSTLFQGRTFAARDFYSPLPKWFAGEPLTNHGCEGDIPHARP